MGSNAFGGCWSLTNAVVGSQIASLADNTFSGCTRLAGVALPAGLTRIGNSVFAGDSSLVSVTIPAGVASIGSEAFSVCSDLLVVYCEGNAPGLGSQAFLLDSASIYYLPGTTGWGPTYGGRPTVLWDQEAKSPRISQASVSNNRFGFTITGVSNVVVMVEASADLSRRAWTPVGNRTLVGGAGVFSDPDWTDYPARFYRLRSP
jgi:hypothetical protein